ncbi:MAG: HDOD domain-containing protein [Pseudomonadota bacterium]|nr:HDOD domain-containing protein [Pseudomonadota bacterium]
MTLSSACSDPQFDPRTLAEQVEHLIALPEVCLQLQALLEDERASARDFAQLIACDAALTARLLHLTNSATFARYGEVDSVAKAITLIGVDELYHLAVAASAANLYRGPVPLEVDLHAFWARNVHCALAARLLGRLRSHPRREQLFTAGLLHHLGWLALYESVPQLAVELATAPASEPVWRQEQNRLGYPLTAVSAALMERWAMPPRLVQPVAGLHAPLSLCPDHQGAGAIIHIAHRVALHLEQDSVSDATSEGYLGLIDPVAWKLSGLRPAVLPEVVRYVSAESWELTSVFLSGAVSVAHPTV